MDFYFLVIILIGTYGFKMQIRCRNKAPLGPLQFQVGVMLGFDPAAITTQIALPANWTVGLIIDTGVQINYTNLEEGCPQCDNGGRK